MGVKMPLPSAVTRGHSCVQLFNKVNKEQAMKQPRPMDAPAGWLLLSMPTSSQALTICSPDHSFKGSLQSPGVALQIGRAHV